ncbi:MAG: hypothetical protein A2506_02025 [Elusimicrobia bacterium RIFOXYD12_FULL_66_9]|nr:MAG: hypothetical protein A2506_02025 [Elusimicrobia bacterium RIFOXYD12_FULL_66_9]
MQPVFTNDAVVFGILITVLAFVFGTSSSKHPFWVKFYRAVPSLLLCYLIPGLLNTCGIIDGEHSSLYRMSKDYLLPAALVLLTLSVDLKAIVRLGPKALILFLTGTLGVIIGGPLALLIMSAISPDSVGGAGPDAVWRGMTTLAGSWIGGGANQAAMKEVYDVSPNIFAKFVAVDVIVANIWMAALLWMAARSAAIDAKSGADISAIDDLKKRVELYQAENSRVLELKELIYILAIGFGMTGLSHFVADNLAPWLAANAPALKTYSLTAKFFWVVVVATTAGLGLSFTRLRALEGAGASKIGSGCIYILVAAIGMQIDVKTVFSDPGLFVLGIIWITIHAAMMLVVAKVIRAPVFYMAVGSQANIGGAASAPIVAAAFHPSLAPVGVLLAVFGYAVGTYGAWICGQLLRVIAE